MRWRQIPRDVVQLVVSEPDWVSIEARGHTHAKVLQLGEETVLVKVVTAPDDKSFVKTVIRRRYTPGADG